MPMGDAAKRHATEIALLRTAWSHSPPGGGQLALREHEVEEAVDQLVLVGHGVVERHRLEAELLAELAHRQRLEAVLVDEDEGGLEDPLSAERNARFGFGGH